MVDVIRGFQYKTAGRGKGILGMIDFEPCRRPGKKVKGEPPVPRENGEPKQPQPRGNLTHTDRFFMTSFNVRYKLTMYWKGPIDMAW